MSQERSHSLLHHLRHLTEAARVDEASDQELVEAFAATRDEGAFGALVRRHGGMVLNLCRRALGNEQDAEDAFQATFLVLAKKARSLHARGLVASWLYGVAHRTALKARTARARRSAHEADVLPAAARDPVQELTVQEAATIIDEELKNLPDKYRAPLVLCCLEGLARDEAARQLGWSVALVKSRLEEARERLRQRLSHRGLPLSAGLLSLGLLGTTAQAGVPPALASATVQAAGPVAGGAATAIVSARVISLCEGVMRTMFWTKFRNVTAVVLVAGALVASASGVVLASRSADKVEVPPAPSIAPARRAPQPAPKVKQISLAKLRPESLKRWGQAEIVVLARLQKVDAGPVAPSFPPVHYHTLHLQIDEPIRGALKKGESLAVSHSVRQKNAPTFPLGKDCIVAMKKAQGRWQALVVEEKSAEALEQVKLACLVPMGWSLDKNQPVSPWAALGKKAWPADAKIAGPFVCAKTGRPALMVGPGVELTVEKVPPVKVVKWGNPDGDGEYKITIKNTTNKAVSVPALLSAGKKVLWQDCLVILCQGKAYAIPGARGVEKAPRPTVLKPGEAISTVVNALALQGPEWPRGGYRIEFQFALGEKSATESFYYLSRHHDVVRQKLLGGKKK
jgi:RNA polymerase sigma factor (sigma-70 family)